MHALDNSTENQTAELVTKIEEMEDERAQLSKDLSIHDAMIIRSEESAYGLSKSMQRISKQLTNVEESMEDAIHQLEQIQPDHELVKKYREKYKKPENQTAELETKIKEIEAERERLSELFSIYDAMIIRSEETAYGLSKIMQRILENLADTDQNMEDAIHQLEQIQPDHELVKSYREKYKKVA